MSEQEFVFKPVGVIHSCFKEKFAIPRQAGLVKEARATLELLPPYDRQEALEGLDAFSHIWLVFVFHAVMGKEWKPRVRPPRLGGNQRVGVFASRSMFRPNPLGLSVVKLEHIDISDKSPLLHLSGIDLLDGTPVLDIKPYLPYSDIVAEAHGGYAASYPGASLQVHFSEEARRFCQAQQDHPELEILIRHLLELDPRPAYLEATAKRKQFGMRLFDYNIKWEVAADVVNVVSIEALASGDTGN